MYLNKIVLITSLFHTPGLCFPVKESVVVCILRGLYDISLYIAVITKNKNLRVKISSDQNNIAARNTAGRGVYFYLTNKNKNKIKKESFCI